MVLPNYQDDEPSLPQSQNQDTDKENNIRYRSVVSSTSVDIKKCESYISTRNKWTHVGGNITRLPPARRKYSLVYKLNIMNRNGIHSVAVSPKHRQVAFGLSNGAVQFRKLSTLAQNDATTCIREASQNDDSYCAVTCLRFVPTKENIFFCSDLTGTIDMFDTEKLCKHMLAKENNEINSIDVNYVGSRIVSGGKDSILRLYDCATGKMLSATVPIMSRSLDANPNKYHQLRIYCVKFEKENNDVFYSGGIDGYVKLWDLREGLNVVRTIHGPYIHGDAMDLWGKVLLTGSWRASRGLDLWDTGSGQHIETLIPTNRPFPLVSEFYECVKFFYGGKNGTVILAGGSGTERLEVFDVVERRLDYALRVGNTVKSIDSTCCTIVCGGLDGIGRIVKFH